MGRFRNSIGFMIRWLPWVTSGTASVYRNLPDKSQSDIKEVAKEPRQWGQSLEKAWDTSKIGAGHFKQTSETLSRILIGRRVSRKERIQARDDLAALSLVVPPLRVFMIPGSQILLGIMARVTPWRMIPDDWIPVNALKKVREKDSPSLEKESSMVRKLLRK